MARMQSNREQDDLMQTYASMSDLELRELNDAEDQLTEIARSILRDEIRKRRLDLSAPPPPPPSTTDEIPDNAVEYTWKVDLITLRDSRQADRVMLALKQSGIESFIRSSRDSYGYAPYDATTVQVPADQLEAAQTVLAHLTPEKFHALASEEEPPAFEPPACPNCHAKEAMLIDTEPVNRWQCDDCGFEWNDPPGTEPSTT